MYCGATYASTMQASQMHDFPPPLDSMEPREPRNAMTQVMACTEPGCTEGHSRPMNIYEELPRGKSRKATRTTLSVVTPPLQDVLEQRI